MLLIVVLMGSMAFVSKAGDRSGYHPIQYGPLVHQCIGYTCDRCSVAQR